MSTNILYLATVQTAPTRYHDMQNFFNTLYAQCQQGFIEIRQKPVQGNVTKKWISVSNPEIPIFPDDQDIYVGVATRKCEYGGGTKADIDEIPAVWVDIDFKDIERKGVEKRIQDFELKPSIVVESGNGLHLYWILETPAQFGDIQKIEDINHRLVIHFDGDEASAEAARILRLPGTYNVKKDPILAAVSSINDNTYHIDDFNFLPQPEPPKPTSSGQTQDWYTGLLQGVQQGKRHDSVLRLTGRYQEKGLSESETQILLSKWNEQNNPPYPQKDLERDITDVYKRYGGGSISLMPHGSGLPDFRSVIEASVIRFHVFMGKEIPKLPYIINPILKRGEIIMISAARGVGKTWFALSLGYVATRLSTIGSWKTEMPTATLYIDGEMSEYEMQDRIRNLEMGRQKEEAPFYLLSSDKMRSNEMPCPNLTNPSWRNDILEYLKSHSDIGLVILDNLASLTSGRDENTKRDWDEINQWLLQLRSKGIAVIFLHHTGKGGEQRGTSAIEDNINFSIKLTRPEGYQSEDSAKFKVEFTKTRRLHGNDTKPFTLQLLNGGNGLNLEVVDDEKKTGNNIISMFKEGQAATDIAKQLGKTDSWVSQVKTDAEKNGELKESDIVTKKRGRKPKEPLEKSKEEIEQQDEEFVDVPCGQEVKEIN